MLLWSQLLCLNDVCVDLSDYNYNLYIPKTERLVHFQSCFSLLLMLYVASYTRFYPLASDNCICPDVQS